MPAHTVKCPECRTKLKSSRPIPVGKLLTCPKCDVLFAAPKPVIDARVIEDVEVVEDVDVIEEVEVLDDAPPRKPARKPAAALKPSRVNAGIEVVEDDEDEEPRSSRKKPAPRPKRKSGGSGAKVVLIVSAAVLGLAVLGGAAWLAFSLLGGGDEPLAYLPAESQIVISADMNQLWASPVGQTLDPLLSNPQFQVAKLKQATNASTRDVLQRVVLAIRPAGSKIETIAVVKGNASVDADKLGTAFSGTKSSVGGRTVYKLPPGNGLLRTLAVPNKHVVIFADLSDEPLGRVLKSGGKSSVLTGDMATLASKFQTSTIWAVAASSDPSFKAGFQAALAANPAAKGIGDALQSAKGFALALNLAGSQVEVKFAALCPDAGTAQNVVTQMQQANEKSKNDAMSKAMMAMMPAAIKTLQEEAESSQQYTTDGSLAVMSFKLNMSTIEQAVGAVTQMASAFGGGAGGPPQMQPMNPPGEQPKEKGNRGGRGGGGGGKGGRGKGKGGGG